jgi:hypothetical protein
MRPPRLRGAPEIGVRGFPRNTGLFDADRALVRETCGRT